VGGHEPRKGIARDSKRAWGGSEGRSGAVLSELLDEVAREPVQTEMSGVRVLFELFGFLLSEP